MKFYSVATFSMQVTEFFLPLLLPGILQQKEILLRTVPPNTDVFLQRL